MHRKKKKADDYIWDLDDLDDEFEEPEEEVKELPVSVIEKMQHQYVTMQQQIKDLESKLEAEQMRVEDAWQPFNSADTTYLEWWFQYKGHIEDSECKEVLRRYNNFYHQYKHVGRN